MDPRRIEEPLYQHPAVELAGAVGKPDPRVGELPVVYVQLKPGASADPDELKEFIRGRVAERAANPTDIFIIDEMPLTGVGKVVKQTLRHDAARRTFEALLQPLVPDGVGFEVTVGNDPVHGTQATVTLSGDTPARDAAEGDVHDALSAYTMSHAIRWA